MANNLYFTFVFKSLQVMRRIFLLALAVISVYSLRAQNFNGQWRGSFSSNGDGEEDAYMLELEVTNGTQVSGYSYTYFDVVGPGGGQHFFTICRVTGTVNRASRSVTVTETEKVKGNLPFGQVDCLQTHTLTYFKSGNKETLEGTWKPAPGYSCGVGKTVLSRQLLVRTAPLPRVTKGPATAGAPRPHHSDTALIRHVPAHHYPVHHHTDSLAVHHPAVHHVQHRPARRDTVLVLKPQTLAPLAPSAPPTVRTAPVMRPLPPQVTSRQEELIQTIEISSPDVRVELYDDGVIDNDTVTVYFNGKTIAYRQMLSHKAIVLHVTALPDQDNDLIVYADNLGIYPPNTALMVAYVGDDKYDVRIVSDLQKNGLIRFRLKKPN